MIKNVGPCIQDKLERTLLTVEIRRQHFDNDLRVQVPNCTDRLSKMICTTICQVIASNRRNDDMLQLHPADRFCDPYRLVLFKSKWFGRGNCTESAGPRASVAGNHECGCPLAPAFPTIRTLRRFTDCMKSKI